MGEEIKTVGQPAVLHALVARLHALGPDSGRRWGTLTPHEMLCHLGDAAEMVLLIRPRAEAVPERVRPVIKWLAPSSPLRWPHGWATHPTHDPRAQGTQPSVFAALKRAIAGLEGIARAERGAFESAHGFFGTMSREDWQRWAYKHTEHHLRQFGL